MEEGRTLVRLEDTASVRSFQGVVDGFRGEFSSGIVVSWLEGGLRTEHVDVANLD